MDLFRSTGESALLLGTTEPRLGELVRRGRIQPPPIVVAGRRLWAPEQLLQAAEALGVLTAELAVRIAKHVKDDETGGTDE